MEIPIEFYLGLGAIATVVYIKTKKNSKPALKVNKTTYDRENHKILVEIENTQSMCYALKSAIKTIQAPSPPQPGEGMMTAAANDSRPLSTLIAEDDYPVIIGPDERIQITYDILVPREFLDTTDLSNLNVDISYLLYEEHQNDVSREIFQGKLKEKLEDIKPEPLKSDTPIPSFIEWKIGEGMSLKSIVIGQALKDKLEDPTQVEEEILIVFNKEKEHLIPKLLEEFKESDLYKDQLGDEITYRGVGSKIGNNTIIFFADLRKKYSTVLKPLKPPEPSKNEPDAI